MMRGKPGTSVKLLILRKSEPKPISLTIVREIIKIRTVRSKLYDKKYGYIRVTHFQSPTMRTLLEAVEKLKKETNNQLAGIVLDLRNNPGGLLDSAIEVSDAFIHNDSKNEEELIVYTKGRVQGSDYTAIANKGDILNNKPIVVLINGGSASGSEIVAGALRDNKRAVIVGEKSFGKGSVQTVIPLDNKSGIKLTTALYYTPAGTSIQAKGIVPDIEIKDITIPKPKSNENIFKITEAQLRGHLGNGNKEKGKKAEKESENKISELIYTDYQLHEAFNILKSLVFAKS